MSKKLLFIFLVFFLCLTGCRNTGLEPATSEPEQELFVSFPDAAPRLSDWPSDNVLVIHFPTDPGGIHPVTYTHANSKALLNLVNGFLVIVNQQKIELLPQLVKALPSVSGDGLEYTYELLDEAVWDDGSPVTAADVVFTLKTHKCPLVANALLKSYVANLQTIRTDSRHPKRFTLVMKRKYIQNVSFLTDIPVLQRSFYDPGNVLDAVSFEQMDAPDFDAEKIPGLQEWSVSINDGRLGNDAAFSNGIGPYRLVRWDAGQSALFERKKNHWTEKLSQDHIYLHAYPEKIVVRFIAEETAMKLEAKAQAIDASTYFPTKVLMELQADSTFNRNYNSAFLKSYTMNVICLNTRPDGIKRKKIFDDIRIRKAMAYLTPVDQLIRIIALGQAQPLASCVSPLRSDCNRDLLPVPYDPVMAGALLDEAGWEDSDGDGIRDKTVDGIKVPLEIEMTYAMQGALMQDHADIIKDGALKGGVRIIQKPVESGLLRQLARERDFDMLVLGWTASSMNYDFTQVYHTSSWGANGSNYTGFGNSASDALIDSIKYTLNDSLRSEMSKRFQQMVYEDHSTIFTYSTYRKVFIHKRWGNQMMTSEFPSLIIQNLRLIPAAAAATLQE